MSAQVDDRKVRKPKSPTDPTIKGMKSLSWMFENLSEKQLGLVFGWAFEQYAEKAKKFKQYITT